MAALVCDICGGKLVMGAGGIAVCDSCGMEYSPNRMKEKIQEVKGTVRVDNSHMIDNWMKMGNAAAQAGNNKEAYDYFIKVIEIDPENWRAIYEKGKAGAWQSTLGNLRTAEIYQGITMAMEIISQSDMDAEEVAGLKNEFAVALFNINNAITDLMEQNLNNFDDKYLDSHWDQMWEMRQRYITNAEQLEEALSLINDLDDDLSKQNVIEFKKRMCSDLQNACESIQYWTSYSQDRLGYFGFTVSEKQKYIDKFWSLVDDIRVVEPDYATTIYTQPDPFDPGFESNRSERILAYWEKRDDDRRAKTENENRKRRFDEYWSEHVEQKKLLEIENSELGTQIAAFNDDINRIPGNEEIKNIEKRIEALSSEKASLGLFKGKEKQAIQNKIDTANSEIKQIRDKMATRQVEIEEMIKPLTDRQAAIKDELTKAR